MSIKKVKLGKVVIDKMGYKVRIMIESKSIEKTDRNGKIVRDSFMGNSGKFGVYAGRKKLVKSDFKSKEEAIKHIDTLIVKS